MLLIVENYAGDRMNFEMAAEVAECRTATVITGERYADVGRQWRNRSIVCYQPLLCEPQSSHALQDLDEGHRSAVRGILEKVVRLSATLDESRLESAIGKLAEVLLQACRRARRRLKGKFEKLNEKIVRLNAINAEMRTATPQFLSDLGL